MDRVEVGVEDAHHLAHLARPQVALGAPPDRQEELNLGAAAGLQGDCFMTLDASFDY